MVLLRSLVLLCAAAAVALSGMPGDGVRAELTGLQDFGNAVYSPHRELREEVVKVHVKLHPDEPAALSEEQPVPKKHSRKHKSHADKAVNEVLENGETVRTYDHGSVRIDSKDAAEAKKKKHHQNKEVQQKPLLNDETVVDYDHGSVKVTGKKQKASVATGGNKDETEAATPNEQEVTSTANEVTELVTQLSSASEDKKSILDTYGPVVIICGIIGGVAAIVGVIGLVITQAQQQKEDNLDSVLGEDVDVDVEANIAPAGADDDDDGKDRLNDSDSDGLGGEDEEEGTFANGTGHVSV